MKIIVVGAGEVGTHLAGHLAEDGHDVVVIDQDRERAERAEDALNALVIRGNGASLKTLGSAGAQGADMIIAVTNVDEVNIVACVMGKSLGIGRRIARVKNVDFYLEGTGRSLRQVGVDIMINPDLAAALEIERLVSLPGASDVSDFGGSRVRMVGAYVEEDSVLNGVALKDVEKHTGPQPATLVAIMREDETIIPDGNTVLQAGDHAFMIGESRSMPKILGFLGHDMSPTRTVMIVGAGPISRHLAKHLSEARINVKLIELVKEKAERTAEELDKVMVLHGDATDVGLLESENVNEMDAFIAASNDEETNLMSCLLASHMGAKKTIAVMRRSNYVPLVHSLGIDAAISVRLNTASAIMKFVRRGEIISFAQLKDNEAEALELIAHADSKIAGIPLVEANFPEDAVIGAIIRGSKIIVPRGDTVIEDGDRVVVFALPSAAGAVGKLFA